MSKWYSLLSTGVLELDCQHHNLDTLLSLIAYSTEDRAVMFMRMFADGLSAHFQVEEDFVLPNGAPFVNEAHEKEHRRLAVLAENAVDQAKTDPDSCDLSAMEFRGLLMSHATYFDIPSGRVE